MIASAIVAIPCAAQTSVNSSTQQIPNSSSGGGSATTMWGAGSGSGTASQSSLDSATMHDTLGQSAALSQSAKRGFLYSSGTSIVFESIGSQSIVDTSIYGDNNIANISANQTSTNNGAVNANGSISLSGNATTTVGGGTPSSGGSGTTAPKAATPAGGATKNNNVQTGVTTLSSSTVGTSPGPSGDVPGNTPPGTASNAGGGG